VNAHILMTVTPRDGKPHVILDVLDSDRPVGRQTQYTLSVDLERPVETRPEWAATYAHYVLFEAAQAIALELDRGRDAQVLPRADGEPKAPGDPGITPGPRW